MKEGYSIDIYGKREVLTGEVVYCFSQNIVELVLPEGCKKVWCELNHLKELVIPEGCEEVSCDYFSNLIIPEGCEVEMFLNIRS